MKKKTKKYKEPKTWTFTVTLAGVGETEEDAWEDAVNAFAMDPGCPDGGKIMEE